MQKNSSKKTQVQFMGHSIEVWKENSPHQRRGRWGNLEDDPYWYGSVDGDLVFAGSVLSRTTKRYAIHYCETEIWKRLTDNGKHAPTVS